MKMIILGPFTGLTVFAYIRNQHIHHAKRSTHARLERINIAEESGWRLAHAHMIPTTRERV